MKLKICGQKHNVEEVAALQPDYLGFIFWEPSSRFFDGMISSLDPGIKKVGVFVDAEREEVLEKVKKYKLDAVQLHGKESAEFCKELEKNLFVISNRHPELVEGKGEKSKEIPQSLCSFQNDRKIDIIKAFSINPDSYRDEFDFYVLKEYEDVCDYFLFDTKGKLPGGTGLTFDWKVLKDYPFSKPYFLSGGIGLENLDSLLSFLRTQESKYCHAIDVNSRFETAPGLKDVEKLKEFKKIITRIGKTK